MCMFRSFAIEDDALPDLRCNTQKDRVKLNYSTAGTLYNTQWSHLLPGYRHMQVREMFILKKPFLVWIFKRESVP